MASTTTHRRVPNPADLDDVVAEVALADADTFVDACRAARAAQRAWAATPAPVRGRAIQQVGPPRRGQQGGARPPRHARDRQALRGVAGRGAGDHRHLQLLPGRGPAPLRPDGAERDARQAAVHVPHAGRRGGDHHGRQLPGRGAVLVPRAGAAVRQRGRVEAGRVRARARRGAGAAVPARRRCPRACSTWCWPTGAQTFAGLERALEDGLRRQGRLHRLHRRRAAHRRAVRAATCSRRASSSAARTRWSSWPTPTSTSRSRARCSAASGRPASAARRSAPRSSHDVGPRRVPRAVRRAAVEGAAIGDPTQDVLYGPMIHERFLERFEDWLELIRDHHSGRRLDRHRADHRRQPARGVRRRSRSAGLYCHPTIVAGVTRRRRASTRPRRSARSSASASFGRLRRGDGPGQRPRLRPVVGDLHERPAVTPSASASA